MKKFGASQELAPEAKAEFEKVATGRKASQAAQAQGIGISRL
jgi:hypothetical protein